MSEDKKKILGDEEPTEELEAQKARTTNPMLEAILAKVNDLSGKVDDLSGKVNDIDGKVNDIDGKVNDLAETVGQGFAKMETRFNAVERRLHTLERKFDVFTIENVNVKASVLDHENRLEDLERKAS
jgi:peptidoglycan hydrolase CwlO-like protein